jgi:tetratricopeptide (TPR) repeat protein
LFVQALGDLYIHRDYEAAARKFELAAGTGHRQDETRYYLADALLKMRDLENAEKNLRLLLQADDSHGRAYELLIHCAVLSGTLDEAETLAKDLAAMYSEEPFPYVLLSWVETWLGREEEALSFCHNALSLDPGYIPAILCRGNLYLSQDKPEAARVSFEKLLLFDDPILSSVGSESIAFVYFLWGRFDEGTEMMDEAIRYAMLVGSVRQGLNYTSRLVDYLLQLGRSDLAKQIINRWFTGFGEVPNQLGTLRLDIFNGNLDSVMLVLEESTQDREWANWMRVLGIDPEKIMALTMIKSQDYDLALKTLGGDEPSQVWDEEYFYLRGYAAFEKGEAELAASSFKQVLACPCGLEFPYHQNPVFYTQTLFYLAEAAVARGDQAEAVTYYTRFLNFWENTDWEMQAVDRAKEKLATLQNLSADNQ